ncbi:hypothetical protein TL16_g06963 [Triparma laevis f. inornata]|uniref:EF-hand domain-containing protein n=1 Tax=Triparma laevis f. inornata TaxID=1714386 RepID=A0A9W7AX76_9STRA|nr:hypothetical protein TL16_g06963 [Triparma laevis f. inornata]
MSLDDATDSVSERLDLNIADGCSLIFSTVDKKLDLMEGYEPHIFEALNAATSKENESLETQESYKNYIDKNLKVVEKELEECVGNIGALDRLVRLKRAKEMGVLEGTTVGKGSSFLRYVLDYSHIEETPNKTYDIYDITDSEIASLHLQIDTFTSPPFSEFSNPSKKSINVLSAQGDIFYGLCLYYRLVTAKKALEELREKWEYLVTEADMNVDRRALENRSAEKPQINRERLDEVIRGILVEGSGERLKRWWELVDGGGDGMLEEDEMVKVVELYQSPGEKTNGKNNYERLSAF